jgi:hypothetical protein
MRAPRQTTTTIAADDRASVEERARRTAWAAARRSPLALLAASGCAAALAVGGSTSLASTSSPRANPSRPSAEARLAADSVGKSVAGAQAIYANETKGRKLYEQLNRIATDGTILSDLSRGNFRGAYAEAEAQEHSVFNHVAHVTRVSVVRGSRVLFNATVNYNGAFVVAPASRVLRSHGRVLGTLLLSIQDVTGYVKLVRIYTGAEVLVRGSGGQVRTTLPAAVYAHLPNSGQVTISKRRYLVGSFRETGWGNERLTVWVLVRG